QRPHVATSGLLKTIERLARTRPTGYNLFHSLSQMKAIVEREGAGLPNGLLRQARKIHADDERACLAMAKHGSKLFKRKERILTYCNTGALATGGIGTALGVIKYGFKKRLVTEVFACETRPVGQGARLTVWECAASGIPVTLICDNMAAALMQAGKVDRIFVGADRIARNGDTSNKIGTFQLALIAKAFRIPFHVVAPASTFDLSLKSGKAIVIEERKRDEVTGWITGLNKVENVRVWNPAFDVTPARLITSYITEQGIMHPPFHY
ncbi:MAG: S-methyl-5-thioribose-1-phosphate isomerase, partial [Calditrichota bacterium]